jgi:hypothetical protein
MVEWASRVDRFAAAVYPSLFAYQYLLELAPDRGPDVMKAEAEAASARP